MNVTEFATIASAIKAAYPNANLLPDKYSKEVWYTMLSDLDYKVCMDAIKRIMSTNKFAPSIAEIREACMIINDDVEDWGAGWEKVLDSIRFCGMYQEEKAFERFDELTRKCVKRLGYKNICLSENIAVDRANFRMIYESLASREIKERQIPVSIRIGYQDRGQIGEKCGE